MVTSHTLSNTASDRVFNAVNYVFLTVMLLAVAYPLYFMAIASFSDPHLVNNGKLWLFPKGITFEGYRRIFGDSRIWTAYLNTTIYTLGGVSVNLLVTIPAAYALSRRDLWGRNLVMVLFTFTLLFGGGLIPTYLIIRSLGVLNTRWVMIIPNAVAVWNLIIARTFFQTTVPPDLLDASRMDGASNLRFFVSVVIPISPAIIAVLALFYGGGPLERVLRGADLPEGSGAVPVATGAQEHPDHERVGGGDDGVLRSRHGGRAAAHHRGDQVRPDHGGERAGAAAVPVSAEILREGRDDRGAQGMNVRSKHGFSIPWR